MRREKAVAIMAAVALAGAFAGCGSDDDTDAGGGSAGTTTSGSTSGGGIDKGKPPVRIAVLGPKLPTADLLTPFEDGAKAAAKAINASGGVGGREVVIDSCNSQFAAATSATCARKTIAKKPVAMIGCEFTWTAAGVPVYRAAKTPSFNCLNSPADLNEEWSFGLAASDLGQQGAAAKWLCAKPDVKTVAALKPDLPAVRTSTDTAVEVLRACGKTVSNVVYYPLTGGDTTPYVNRAVKGKPDFLITSGSGPQSTAMFKALRSGGYPADQMILPDTQYDFATALKALGTMLDGSYAVAQYTPWGETDDPEIQEYTKATEAAGVDGKNATVVWSYALVQYIKQVAEKTGPDGFDGAALAEFTQTQNDVQMPLSRKLTNPGPPGAPQNKQPFAKITQYQGDGKFVAVDAGDGGWFDGIGK